MIYTVTLNPAWDEFRFLDSAGALVDTKGRAGGKGVNVARVLTSLAAPSEAFLLVGGEAGRRFEASGDFGRARFFPIGQATRLNVKWVEPNGTVREENEAGPCVSEAEAGRLIEALADSVRPGDLVALCGSLPRGLGDETYADMIGLLQRRGAETVLDTSGAPLARGLAAGPALIKPNLDEYCSLIGAEDAASYGGSAAIEAIDADAPPAVRLAALRPLVDVAERQFQDKETRLLLSLGSLGALLVAGRETYYASARVGAVRHTTGAGDSLLAGYLAARGAGEAARLREAAAAAAAATAVSGRPFERERVELRRL